MPLVVANILNSANQPLDELVGKFHQTALLCPAIADILEAETSVAAKQRALDVLKQAHSTNEILAKKVDSWKEQLQSYDDREVLVMFTDGLR